MEFPRFEGEVKTRVVEWLKLVSEKLKHDRDELSSHGKWDARERAVRVSLDVVSDSSEFMEETIENATLDVFISLVTLLLDFELQNKATVLFLRLAQALGPSKTSAINMTNTERDLRQRLGVGWKHFEGIFLLFCKIGPALSIITPVAISSLEALVTHPHLEKRILGVVVVTALIHTNKHLFRPAYIAKVSWDVLLQLDASAETMLAGQDYSMASTWKSHAISHKRMAFMKATHALAPSVGVEDEGFHNRVVTTLLGTRTRTKQEQETQVEVLREIVRAAVEENQEKQLHNIFLALLSRNQEELFRSLYIAVQECIRASPQNSSARVNVDLFLKSLERYILASEPTLRYGALLCVHATLTSFPLEFLNVLDSSLFSTIVSECLDHSHTCSLLSLQCVKAVLSRQAKTKRNSSAEIELKEDLATPTPQSIVRAIREYESYVLRSPGDVSWAVDGSFNPSAHVRNIVNEVLPWCKNVPEQELLRLSSGLQHLPELERLSRLEILLLWAKRLHEVIPLVINNLLIAIRGSEGKTGIVASETFRALAPMLERALRERDLTQNLKENSFFRAVCAIETGLLKVLESCHEDLAVAIFHTLKTMPFEYFEEPRLTKLLHITLRKSLTATAATVRKASVLFLCGSARFWRTKALKIQAVGSLLSSLGDPVEENVSALIPVALPFLKEAGYVEVGDLISKYRSDLVSTDPAQRISAFNGILNGLAGFESSAICKTLLTNPWIQSKLAEQQEKQQLVDNDGAEESVEKENRESKNATTPLVSSTKEADCNDTIFFLVLANFKLPDADKEVQKLSQHLLMQAMGSFNDTIRALACQCLLKSFLLANDSLNVRQFCSFLEVAFLSVSSPSTSSMVLLESIYCVLTSIAQSFGFHRPLRLVLLKYVTFPAFSILENENTHPGLRRWCISFVSAMITLSPKDARVFLDVARDAIRRALRSKDRHVLAAATEAYPVIVHMGTNEAESAEDYFEFLATDLAPIREEVGFSDEVLDPLSSNLDVRQMKTILNTTLRAIGEIQNPDTVPKAIDILLDVIHHKDPQFRASAAKSLLSLSEKLEQQQRAAIRWVILPLVADPSQLVRSVFSSYLLGTPFDNADVIIQATSPHVNATVVDKQMEGKDQEEGKEGDATDENETLDVSEDLLYRKVKRADLVQEAFFQETHIPKSSSEDKSPKDVDKNEDQADSNETMSSTAAAALLQGPRVEVGMELLAVVRRVSTDICGRLEFDLVDIVEYHLHHFMDMSIVNGASAIVLSEVARLLCTRGEGLPEDEEARVRNMLTALYLNVGAEATSQASINNNNNNKSQDGEDDDMFAMSLSTNEDQAVTTQKLGLVDDNLLFGSAIGIRNVVQGNPELTLPFLMSNTCCVEKLTFGHLVMLKYLFQLMEDSALDAKAFIPSTSASKLKDLILETISSAESTIKMKKAALELIGRIASIVGREELSNVVQCMLSILEESSDVSIHAMSQAQLSKVFSSFDSSHPFVSSLIEHVEAGLTSCEAHKRQRSFTLLSIVAKPMGPARAIPGIARALADPDERIRQMAVKSLINHPPAFITSNKRFTEGVRALVNQMELKKSEGKRRGVYDKQVPASRRQRQRGKGGPDEDQDVSDKMLSDKGLDGQEAQASDTKNMTIPFGDDDPLNVTFLQTDQTYKRLLEEYGMDVDACIERHVLAASESDQPGLKVNDKGWFVTVLGLSEQSVSGLLKADTFPLIGLLLAVEPSAREYLLQKIDEDIDSATQLARSAKQDRSQTESAEAESKGDHFGLVASKSTMSDLQMDQLIHNLQVYARILRSPEALPTDCTTMLAKLEQLVEYCAQGADIFRAAITRRMNEMALLTLGALSLPFLPFDHLDAMGRQQAKPEGGNKKDDRKRKELLQQELFLLNNQLWLVSALQEVVLQTISTVFTSARKLDSKILARGVDWLIAQLSLNKHRDLREASRKALIAISKPSEARPAIKPNVSDSLIKIRSKLEENKPDVFASNQMIYRAKVDMLHALVQLLPYGGSPGLVRDTIAILVSFWDDADSFVRLTAIQLVETLGDSDIPGIKQVLRITEQEAIQNATAISSNTTTAVPMSLRTEISKRINDPSYMEKEQLSRLLQWLSNEDTSSS